MFLGIFLTRAVPILRQSYFSSTSFQYQLVAWHPCVANFITSVSLAVFSSDASLAAQDWGSIMPTVNHLASTPSSSALTEAESLEISPPSRGNQCKNWGAVIRRTRIRGTLSCVSVILFLGICPKEIIWKNLVIEAGSYRALTTCQHYSNCCMYIDLLTTITTPQGCINMTFILQMRKPRNRGNRVYVHVPWVYKSWTEPRQSDSTGSTLDFYINATAVCKAC